MRLLTTPLTAEDIEPMAYAGADGLLFGSASVSLRNAADFSSGCWKELIRRCHDCGVEALFLMNRLFMEEELPMMKEHLQVLLELGADGIYFADEAVLSYAQCMGEQTRLLYQPDTLLTNHSDVNYYLEEGCKGVVLAKEITRNEILTIAEHCDASRIEFIGHGRLIMMHSLRPLLSNYMEFLNQDISLQNKRNLYLVEDTRSERMPILEDEAGTHIFSGYVQNSFCEMEAFLKAGIGAMRIDGIFYGSDEIIQTLAIYDGIRKGKWCGEEAKQMFCEQFPMENIDTGFYYRATSTKK